MHLDLSDRVVVVTGGARGIGRTIAERFRREGAHVVALDLAAALADRGADDQPGGPPTVPDGAHAVGAHAVGAHAVGAHAVATPAVEAHALEALACDVTDPASVRAAVDAVVARHGTVDVLVNNAGINVEGRVVDLEWDAWRRCMDVNLGGTFLMSQAVAPVMQRAGRGRIINAASFAAIVPSVGSAAYAASKAAVVQFTRVLASELGPWGITVNAYAPGMVPTAMNGFATMPTADQDRLLDTLSIRRWETPDDVADVLLFLASDLAGYVTGTLLDVSGGKLATQIPSRAYED